MKMATASTLSILDNSLLESSMGSTQGLLTFMTDASKQIKTYLGDENEQQKKQRKNQRHKLLLQQLSKLNTQGDFIPEILTTTSYPLTTSTAYFDNQRLNDDIISKDDEFERPSCLMSRKRKNNPSTSFHCDLTKRLRFEQNLYHQTQNNNSYRYSCQEKTTTRRQNDVDNTDSIDCLVPSPTPDFDDLVDCLTDDYIAPIDLNSYFKTIV